MSPLASAPPHVAVAVGSALLAAAATAIVTTRPGFPVSLFRVPFALVERVRSDIARGWTGAAPWIGIGAWSTAVSALHFHGMAVGLYTRIHWWDHLTHSMGGLGVAAILSVGLFRHTDDTRAVWLLLGSVTAIGAGFEVYEFLFRNFWHNWSVETYAVDTAVDMWFNVLGGSIVVTASHLGRSYWSTTGTIERGG